MAADPTPELEIAADHARRFLVRRHLLEPPRSLPAEPASVLRVIQHLGLLQFDPLEVPGARNHDLVLHAR
ncbi:MAG TPA: winged helix-turn-helix domain-containing protein, partial [Candidatus Limnocylindria bacterium]|nr:winged helix-turn-helix domain-containing protein [Candidatus Limnocylindria bacterium]